MRQSSYDQNNKKIVNSQVFVEKDFQKQLKDFSQNLQDLKKEFKQHREIMNKDWHHYIEEFADIMKRQNFIIESIKEKFLKSLENTDSEIKQNKSKLENQIDLVTQAYKKDLQEFSQLFEKQLTQKLNLIQFQMTHNDFSQQNIKKITQNGNQIEDLQEQIKQLQQQNVFINQQFNQIVNKLNEQSEKIINIEENNQLDKFIPILNSELQLQTEQNQTKINDLVENIDIFIQKTESSVNKLSTDILREKQQYQEINNKFENNTLKINHQIQEIDEKQSKTLSEFQENKNQKLQKIIDELNNNLKQNLSDQNKKFEILQENQNFFQQKYQTEINQNQQNIQTTVEQLKNKMDVLQNQHQQKNEQNNQKNQETQNFKDVPDTFHSLKNEIKNIFDTQRVLETKLNESHLLEQQKKEKTEEDLHKIKQELKSIGSSCLSNELEIQRIGDSFGKHASQEPINNIAQQFTVLKTEVQSQLQKFDLTLSVLSNKTEYKNQLMGSYLFQNDNEKNKKILRESMTTQKSENAEQTQQISIDQSMIDSKFSQNMPSEMTFAGSHLSQSVPDINQIDLNKNNQNIYENKSFNDTNDMGMSGVFKKIDQDQQIIISDIQFQNFQDESHLKNINIAQFINKNNNEILQIQNNNQNNQFEQSSNITSQLSLVESNLSLSQEITDTNLQKQHNQEKYKEK